MCIHIKSFKPILWCIFRCWVLTTATPPPRMVVMCTVSSWMEPDGTKLGQDMLSAELKNNLKLWSFTN